MELTKWQSSVWKGVSCMPGRKPINSTPIMCLLYDMVSSSWACRACRSQDATDSQETPCPVTHLFPPCSSPVGSICHIPNAACRQTALLPCPHHSFTIPVMGSDMVTYAGSRTSSPTWAPTPFLSFPVTQCIWTGHAEYLTLHSRVWRASTALCLEILSRAGICISHRLSFGLSPSSFSSTRLDLATDYSFTLPCVALSRHLHQPSFFMQLWPRLVQPSLLGSIFSSSAFL